MESIFRFDRLFPYGIPPLLTALACLFMVLLTIKSGRHNRENKLFAIICLMLFSYNVDFLCHIVLASKQIASIISQLNFMVLIFSVPMSVQLVHYLLGISHRRWLERLLYGVCFSLLPVTQTDLFISEGYDYYFGSFPEAQTGLYLYLVLGTLSGAYYLALLVLAYGNAQRREFKRKMFYVIIGFPVGWLMVAANMLTYSGFEIYPPSTYAFVPLSLMAYGLLQHSLFDTSQSFIKKGYLGSLLSYVVFVPLIMATIFVITSEAINFHDLPTLVERLFSHAFAPFVSLLTCMGLSIYCLSKGLRRVETILFGLICLLWGLLSLDRVLLFFILPGYESIAVQIVRTSHFFFVMQSALYLHFIYLTVQRTTLRMVLLYYALGFLFMPVTQTRFYFQETLLHYEFGLYPRGYWGIRLLGVFVTIALVWGSILIYRAWRSEHENNRKKQLYYIFIGLIVSGLLNLGSLPAALGIEFYPTGYFIFLPILIMAYGILRHNVLQINIYTKKRIFAEATKLVLFIGYGAPIPIAFWALEGLSLETLLNKAIPMGIPPLLSFISCLFLSILLLRLAQNLKEALLFSLISLVYGLVNLDLFFNMIVQDPLVGLQIVRWDQSFFVFIGGLGTHFSYTFLQKKSILPWVYLTYALGLISLPFIHTPYYFKGTYTYYWGYFPQSGILFDLICFIWFSGSAFIIYMIFQAYKSTVDFFQKQRIRVLFSGFLFATVLTVGDFPALHGIELYPLGAFIFIPVTFIIYSLFQQNPRESLKILRVVIFWVGVLLALWSAAILAENALVLDSFTLRQCLAIVLTLSLYSVVKNSWNTIIDLFIRNPEDDFRYKFYRLTDRLSQVRNLFELHKTLSSLIINEFYCIRYGILFYFTERRKFEGWEIWNQRLGVFSEEKEDKHPLGNAKMLYEAEPFIFKTFSMDTPLVPQKRFEEALLEQKVNSPLAQRLLQAELLQSVFFQEQLTCLLLLDPKIDNSPYTPDEKKILSQLGLILGPHIEHAKLLYGLEQQVQQRTHELSASNDIVGRQNQIFRSLLETSASMHKMHELEQFFLYTLNQLQTLFSHWGFGLIIHGERAEIVQFVAFQGIPEAEQQLILKNAAKLLDENVERMLSDLLAPDNSRFIRKRDDAMQKWLLLPMNGREKRIVGNLLIKGPKLDQLSIKTITLFLEQVTSVAENKLLTQELEKLANTDGLTGTYNRTYYMTALQRIILQAEHYSEMYFSTLMIDVNGLKKVNDVFGHEAGDVMIIKVAELLREVCRKSDIIVRLGGDEFVILSPSTGYQSGRKLLERIREREKHTFLECPHKNGQVETLPVHLSIGLASSEDTPPKEVIKKADHLMYQDKEAYYTTHERYR
ncbi:GGDEF domain-containing protein [Deltaproteobacteria bacterium TL4]